MKKLTLALALITLFISAGAQHKKSDTLLVALQKANTDTNKFVALITLSRHYYITYPDSGIIYAQKGYEIAQKNNWLDAQGFALKRMADSYGNISDYVKSMQYYFKALRAYESINDMFGEQTVYNNIGSTYLGKQDYKNALLNLYKAKRMMDTYLLSHKPDNKTQRSSYIISLNIGETYLGLKKVDSAEYYLNNTNGTLRQLTNAEEANEFKANIALDLGQIATLRGDKQAALKYFRSAVSISIANQDIDNLSKSYLSAAKLYHQYKQQDSAEYFGRKAIEVATSANFAQDVLDAGTVLYSYYDEDQNLPEAYKYYKITTRAKDSLYSQDKVKQLLSLDFDEKQRQQDIAAAQQQYRENVRMYALIAVLAVFLLLVIIFWRNSNQRKKANQLLQQQKEEIQTTLGELKTTQNQLVQSAKMASLGELTAGIAHEIQNPLNFVNNFSDVNREMIGELRGELKNGNVNEALAIADDIEQNEVKINHHGKRADFIVKGMLEHSRTSTGERQVTNINVLADEFLKLSYHGLRAKDKSFNADLVTHFDPSLPKLNVVQQDIGRVLINLFSNAFYAVNQKAKTTGPDYKPTVEVSTTKENGSILIKIKDNGTGIPDAIREKIMQPFFTTKPTGDGTGLGLSLSYDIVVKGHGGNIDVNTKEGEFTEFIVSLPL
ncbi:ATP-binding protein [Mucilaginibacter sp. BT774]|uniref:ATP-binding protein n=1 Tax=Mucilaginibacter sp. BT774 TaxID=3062276 RepID=UPI0026758882|nr:ATP-binding protein [Mucilaginibacter sp. BT774]MDO3627972.1 ATP-binding protein [Mucilaginibacter sp. BT774]